VCSLSFCLFFPPTHIQWKKRAGDVLESSLIEPLTAIMGAYQSLINKKSNIDSETTSSSSSSSYERRGDGGEMAVLIEALNLYSTDLNNILHEV
jgi:hypothetical protein